jgi:DNA mismatch repair protein MutS2
MGEIDYIRAKALFAIEFEATKPILNKTSTGIYLRQARHPILQLSLKKDGKGIVPLDLELNPNGRILLISGPNAGGKSVCLKTVGLLQYMLQCGILPCCLENSEMGVFSSIFIDIGDEQSLENDLSTYSSHLIT